MSAGSGDAGAPPVTIKEQEAAPTSHVGAQATEERKSKEEHEEVEEFPDPDEDDLDDLDDMLDDFNAKVDLKKPEPSATVPEAPSTAIKAKSTVPETDDLDEALGVEFTKHLQAEMASMLGGGDPESLKSPEAQKGLEEEFEKFMKDMMTQQDGAAFGSGEEGASGGQKSFMDTVQRTMERMQASGDNATSAAAAGGSDDFLSEMMKQMAAAGGAGGAGGEGSEEDLSKMLLGMMEQLTNKDILYEPMKELNGKFPDWLENNKAKTPADDLKRYEEQLSLVKAIVAKFEEPGYSDSNAADREYIVDRMQKMQAAGSPPSDLIGDMPSAQDAFGTGDEGCTPQ